MGLAAFGDHANPNIEPNLSVDDYGKLKLDYKQMKHSFVQPNIFGLDLSNSPHHQSVALQVQSETEEAIIKLLNILGNRISEIEALYLSGGVALNVVANERIINSQLFKNVILNGSVEDNGSAIGAALAVHTQLGLKKKSSKVTDWHGRLYSQKIWRKLF